MRSAAKHPRVRPLARATAGATTGCERVPVTGKRGTLTLVAAAFLSLAGCDALNAPGAAGRDDTIETDADTARPVPVEVGIAERGEIVATYSGTASLEPLEEAQVVAKVSGQIEEILVEEGDIVVAGQVLAQLDGDRLRLQLEQARANLAKAEQDYRRNVDLHEKGLVASGAFENIKYDMDALRAAYNIAKLEFDYSAIRAPIDGVVSERLIKVGNTIGIDAACFRIANLKPLVAYLHVPEREFGKIAAGQPVDVRVDALPAQRFSGIVARISPVVDAATATFKTTVELDPLDATLKPGMFARMHVIYDTRANAILIPRSALAETEIGASVFVIEDNKALRRSVAVGFGQQDKLEILDGIEVGEWVVVVGQTGLKDGASVQVVGDPPADASGLADDGGDEIYGEAKQAAADAPANL